MDRRGREAGMPRRCQCERLVRVVDARDQHASERRQQEHGHQPADRPGFAHARRRMRPFRFWRLNFRLLVAYITLHGESASFASKQATGSHSIARAPERLHIPTQRAWIVPRVYPLTLASPRVNQVEAEGMLDIAIGS